MLAIVVVFGLVLTACSDDAGNDGELATLDSSTDQVTDVSGGDPNADAEAALLVFAQCIRENGFPEYPDISLNPDGSIGFGGALGQLDAVGIDPQSDEFVTALGACSDTLAGVAIGLVGEGFDDAELQDQLLQFAMCMRQQGLDVDDPQLSDFRDDAPAGEGPFSNLDLDDPAVRDALDLCRREIAFPGLGVPLEDGGSDG